MKDGAVYPDKDDSGVPGMTENPDFHGLYERRHSGNEEVNYLASYRFMIKIGNEYGKGKTYTSVSKADIPWINRYKLFKNPFNDGESTKEELFQKL